MRWTLFVAMVMACACSQRHVQDAGDGAGDDGSTSETSTTGDDTTASSTGSACSEVNVPDDAPEGYEHVGFCGVE